GITFDDVEGASLARDLPVPGLVVHDKSDREVPWRIGAQVAAAWPMSRLHLTEGLGHRRILRDPPVVDEIARVIGVARVTIARAHCGGGEQRAPRTARALLGSGAPRCAWCTIRSGGH